MTSPTMVMEPMPWGKEDSKVRAGTADRRATGRETARRNERARAKATRQHWERRTTRAKDKGRAQHWDPKDTKEVPRAREKMASKASATPVGKPDTPPRNAGRERAAKEERAEKAEKEEEVESKDNLPLMDVHLHNGHVLSVSVSAKRNSTIYLNVLSLRLLPRQ